MKIIVAEDDPVTRERLCNTLFILGHDVRAFENGKEAWAAFKINPADVIISDWIMPELDGIEFCASIRKAATTDYVYFILITALRTDNSDYDRAVQAGVDDFLVKPVGPGDIWRRLFVAERFIKYTAEIRQLKNLIPICMHCNQVRNDDAYWLDIERYTQAHEGIDLQYGICPACKAEHAKHVSEAASKESTS